MKMSIGNQKFESSVRGCWLGKNIGGTLEAPFEGQTEMHGGSRRLRSLPPLKSPFKAGKHFCPANSRHGESPENRFPEVDSAPPRFENMIMDAIVKLCRALPRVRFAAS